MCWAGKWGRKLLRWLQLLKFCKGDKNSNSWDNRNSNLGQRKMNYYHNVKMLYNTQESAGNTFFWNNGCQLGTKFTSTTKHLDNVRLMEKFPVGNYIVHEDKNNSINYGICKNIHAAILAHSSKIIHKSAYLTMKIAIENNQYRKPQLRVIIQSVTLLPCIICLMASQE